MEEGRVGHGFPVWNMLLGYVSHVLLGKSRLCLEGFSRAARTCLFRIIRYATPSPITVSLLHRLRRMFTLESLVVPDI